MVTMFVAITDRHWFDLLSADEPDEVNFWQPSGGKAFRALSVGELLLFKLHSPNDYIVGGGIFSHASNVMVPRCAFVSGLSERSSSLMPK